MYEDVYTKSWRDFTWDTKKERINLAKHGLDFRTAVTVFADPHLITEQDREVDGEPRWQTIGIAEDPQILLVAHTTHGRRGIGGYNFSAKSHTARKEEI
jgi:uncharacterized DUF497 family protein